MQRVNAALAKRWPVVAALWLLAASGAPQLTHAHEAKDFDDSLLYKIDFKMPDFDANPELMKQLKTFYTQEKEKYDCVIPVVEDMQEEKKSNEPELSPFALLQPIFNAPSCSYRIEAYWSYEICHGHHVRQYHEEREGKAIKFQEYYLGKWSEEKTEQMIKTWEEQRKAGIKYKTTKIENTKYPYFELEMSDGTLCDIIDAPRTTIVRYVCYPHGKNEIYSFKETSSCNYEAIILTSALCLLPAFHPEESKEVSIKCFNSPTETHKPLSMLRQELRELQISEDDFPVSKESSAAAAELLARTDATNDRYMFLNKFGSDVDKLVLELMVGAGVDVDTTAQQAGGGGVSSELVPPKSVVPPGTPLTDMSAIREFLSGCLTGGTGWWKYEFCYGRHVRQFHKDKKSDTELFLGYFSNQAHRQWVAANPDKGAKRPGYSASLWHHYERGSHCDRTGLPREVDVKLTCTPMTSSTTTVSMYLLEPKTCQYILVVESPIVCELIQLADVDGLVEGVNLQRLLSRDTVASSAASDAEKRERGNLDPTGATGTVSEAEVPLLPNEDVRA